MFTHDLRVFKCVRFVSAVRSESPVTFRSRLFDQIFCYAWLSALTSADGGGSCGGGDFPEPIATKIISRLRAEKSFEWKVFCEHVSAKLWLDVLRFRCSSSRAHANIRSVLGPMLRLYPSSPVVLDVLASKSDLRPSVANPFWRETLKVTLFLPGPNPTIASYNASVVKSYNATNSVARF
jgi:hypothetical protein